MILRYEQIIDADSPEFASTLTSLLNHSVAGPICIVNAEGRRDTIRDHLERLCETKGYTLVTLDVPELSADTLQAGLLAIALSNPALLLLERADEVRPEQILPTGESVREVCEHLATSGFVGRAFLTRA